MSERAGPFRSRPSRRAFVAAVGASAAVALAGCSGDSTDGDGGDGDDGPTVDPPIAGDRDADVGVKVFEDFACPHCRTFNREVWPDLRSEYVESGEVRYEHRDFPVPVDDAVSWEAPSAARAVQTSHGDEAFFEYADLLYENQSSLDRDAYADLAEEVGADPDTVRDAAADRAYDATVESDRQHGEDLGVRGTPTVFVDGEQVDADFDAIADAVEEARSGDE